MARLQGEARRGQRSARTLCALVLLTAIAIGVSPGARADGYDSERAGHPIRIAAYLLHPAGVILDLLIFRPAYWVAQWRPIGYLVGMERRPEDLLSAEISSD